MVLGVTLCARVSVRRATTARASHYAVITIAIRLRYDYDVSRAPASIRREQKVNMSISRRNRIVVVS